MPGCAPLGYLVDPPSAPPPNSPPSRIFLLFKHPLLGNTMAPQDENPTVEVNKEEIRRAGDLVSCFTFFSFFFVYFALFFVSVL